MNGQLPHRVMKNRITRILTLLFVALGLVLFATGCGPL
jgi:hypothetical protein